ncbi:MAG: DMT family transporter [Desulfobacterales bacterium]|jgi:drug/metabolite transporter (DMT)-like permease|nr:DMT family transporter [Desulfobacterales bacterium]
MSANILFLYGSTVIIWGTTWLAIKFQLGSVDPMVSVLYRFIAAAVILLVYCKLRGLNMRFRLKDHIFMALQGLVLFSVNYWLIYLAEVHVTSGLVAVIFSSIVFMNMVNGAVLLGSPIRSNVVLGGGIGVLGIVLVFWPQLVSLSLSDKTALGLLLTVVSTFMASLGNIISARHQKYNLPVVQTNAYGMAYGAVIMGVIAIFLGKPFNFEISFPYISSLFYLSLFGTVIAFGCYLKLIGEIGADRAAYATMLFPIVALGISTVYEGYQWAAHNVIGMAIVLIGNWLVLNKKAMAKRLSSE